MKLVIQLWTPTMAFFEAAPIKRAEAISQIRSSIAAVPGVESLGWGPIDAEAAHSSAHSWVSVWRIDCNTDDDALLTALETAGWFHWFDSTTVRSEISRSVDADDALIAIPHIEGTL